MGYSRDTFYRVKKAYDEGGLTALKDKSRKIPNLKNHVDERIEQQVLDIALAEPTCGQKRVSDELRQEEVFISPAGVRGIWL